ncbi:MAG: hypothetical protein ACO1SV_07555 [Fimbriimonas sp.]
MRICLRCRRWSPRGSLYCVSGCGSFEGSRCGKGHLTPGLGTIARCPVCRSTDIVPAVPSIGLGWLFRLAAWMIALGVVREVLARPDVLFRATGHAIAWLVGPRLLAEASAVLSFLLALKVFVWCVSVFDAEGAKRIDPFPKLIPFLVKNGGRVIAGTWRLLMLLVEGRPFPKKKSKKDRKEE